MGKAAIMMVLCLAMVVGSVFTITARRQTGTEESVKELHYSQTARQDS
jgi:hypothetical protein